MENSSGQRSTANTVEFIEINLQAHDEQEVDRADVRDELKGLTVWLQKIESAGAHQHAREQQADEIGKTRSPE